MDKYASLKANWLSFDIDFHVQNGVDVHKYRRWYKKYVRMVHAGPERFWTWYGRQRALYSANALPFDPVYPHEVFAQLKTAKYTDFYDKD